MAAVLECVETHHSISRPGTEALGAQITELCAYIYAATYQLLVLIRAFDEQDGWHQEGLCSCAHWLNFKCGIGMNAAREKVRVAHALKELPNISCAFERGEISYSKVRAMTRIADTNNEDYLLMIARHGTAHHVEKLVARFRRAERLQDCETANRQHENRFFDYHYDDDGCLVLKGRLPAEQGALIIKALEMAMEKEFSSDVTAGQVPSGRTSEVAADEPEPVAARRADALADVAESYMAAKPVHQSTADRYQVAVHVSADSLSSGDTSAAYIEDGPHVTAETSRRIACDCSLLKIEEDEKGEPLSIGRKTRSIPPAIHRALRFRDQGCRFPGCTRRHFVDGHHIQHWADGGETSLDNLVQLCRHHHRLVHEGGYDCVRSASGEIVFTAPDQRTLSGFAFMPPVDDDPYDWFERELRQYEIAADTCVPQWRSGESIDWDMAVSALFPSQLT